jgi:hypothetical protein
MRHAALIFMLAAGPAAMGAASAIAAPARPAVQVATEKAWVAAIHAKPGVACSDAIGLKPAQALANFCMYESGATHPPCNSANACSVATDSLSYSCPGAKSPEELPCEADTKASEWKIVAKLHAG